MGTSSKLEVYDPTAEITTGKEAPRSKLDSLDGKTIGVLCNGRAEAGCQILDRAVGILRERHKIKEVVFRVKPYLGNIAPNEMFDEMVSSCDAVITGVGD